MIRIFIFCEGQTEETFVNRILKDYLINKNIYLTVILLGGGNTYGKIKRQINIKCKNDKTAYITSMIDLYALPHDFPEKTIIDTEKNSLQKIIIAENAFKNDINQDNFIPNLVLHEFEALLLSDISKFNNLSFSQVDVQNLAHDIQGLNPEEINNSKETAPSKRILKYLPNYKKITDSNQIAEKIGIAIMRKKCPHFNEWLETIEKLKSL